MKYLDECREISSKIKKIYIEGRSKIEIQSLNKGHFDEVTGLDLLVERELINLICSFDSGAHIISEELNCDKELCGKTWIIDPIDGTCNLTHGIRLYGIQCALYENEVGIYSIIFFPEVNELFVAVKGEGATLNGKPIHASQRPSHRAIISFGDFIHANPSLVSLEHKIMADVAPNVEKIRMFGAASIDFAYAACGRIDGNFTFTNKAWDILPGLLLCKESGMIISDAFGAPYDLSKETVAVFSTQKVFQACIH